MILGEEKCNVQESVVKELLEGMCGLACGCEFVL